MTIAIYVIMASRDRSDREVHSDDYPVCYFVDWGAADEYARIATERADRIRIDLDLRRQSFPFGIAYDQGLKLAKDDMASLDPGWEHGSEGGTTYSVVAVPVGSFPSEASPRWCHRSIALRSDDASVTGEITDDQIRQMATWSLEHGAYAVAALRVTNGPIELAERNHSRVWLAAAWKAHCEISLSGASVKLHGESDGK